MGKALILEYDECLVLSHKLYHTVSGIHILQLYFCFRSIRIDSNKEFHSGYYPCKESFGDSCFAPLLWLLIKFLRLNFL